MAASGNATLVIREPKMETVAAPQTRTNAELRQSGELNGCGTSAEHIARRAASPPMAACDALR